MIEERFFPPDLNGSTEGAVIRPKNILEQADMRSTKTAPKDSPLGDGLAPDASTCFKSVDGEIDESCGAILLVGLDGKVLAASPAFAEIWRIKDPVLNGADFESILRAILPQLIDCDASVWPALECFTGSKTGSTRILNLKDGRTIERHSGAMRVGDQISGILFLYRDITAQLKWEQEARSQEAFFRALAEATLDGILVMDAVGNHVLETRELAKIWNAPPGTPKDDPLAGSIAHAASQVRDPVKFFESIQFLRANPMSKLRDQLELKDGTILDRFSAPVVGEDGALYGRLLSFRDVTELVTTRQRAEEATIAKSMFLATMSHEIRTPLNGIIGLTSLLLDGDLSADVRETLKTIKSSGDTLLHVINDVLDFSKMEAGRLEIQLSATNIALLVDDLVALYRPCAIEQSIDLGKEVAAGSEGTGVNVWIDAVRVRQILSNLLGNAVKFTPNGEVRLEWGIDVEGANSSLHFCVIDTGIGIPADRLEAIFESFSQANASIHVKYGGTGLGLAVSKRLAELMGGSITVSSKEGVGTEFRVEIPVVVTAISDAKPTQRSGAERRVFSGRVLLAEDNPVNVLMASKMLHRSGCLADVAINGVVAAQMAADCDYDLVLMDVMMPVCGGLEATKAIRARESQRNQAPIPIVALTASAFQGDRDACFAAGMDGFLAKPFTFDQLREVLDTWLPVTDSDRLAA